MLLDLLFNLRDLDQACKEYYFKADAELAAISIGAAVFMIPPMAYLDYFYYGFSIDFHVSLLFELLFAAFSIGIVLLIMRNKQVNTHEILVFTWGLITSIFAYITTIFQPNRVVENILFCLLFLVANFITIQNRFLFRMISAAVIYITFLTAILTNHTWLTFPNNYMLTLMLLMLTVVGITVVASNNYHKLTTFALQKDERKRAC